MWRSLDRGVCSRSGVSSAQPAALPSQQQVCLRSAQSHSVQTDRIVGCACGEQVPPLGTKRGVDCDPRDVTCVIAFGGSSSGPTSQALDSREGVDVPPAPRSMPSDYPVAPPPPPLTSRGSVSPSSATITGAFMLWGKDRGRGFRNVWVSAACRTPQLDLAMASTGVQVVE